MAQWDLLKLPEKGDQHGTLLAAYNPVGHPQNQSIPGGDSQDCEQCVGARECALQHYST